MVIFHSGQTQASPSLYNAPQNMFRLVLFNACHHPKKVQSTIVLGSIHTVVIVWHLSVGFALSGGDVAVITQQRES